MEITLLVMEARATVEEGDKKRTWEEIDEAYVPDRRPVISTSRPNKRSKWQIFVKHESESYLPAKTLSPREAYWKINHVCNGNIWRKIEIDRKCKAKIWFKIPCYDEWWRRFQMQEDRCATIEQMQTRNRLSLSGKPYLEPSHTDQQRSSPENGHPTITTAVRRKTIWSKYNIGNQMSGK